MRSTWALCLATLFAGCATGSGGEAPAATGAEAEVVRAAEALFAAMESRDTAALRAMFAPDARIVAVRVQPGAPARAQSRPVSDFVASIGAATEPLRERMWEPRVEVGAELASLWAPYDFHVGERFSHCGHDAFHFVRAEGGWRIAALSYTIDARPCAGPPGAR